MLLVLDEAQVLARPEHSELAHSLRTKVCSNAAADIAAACGGGSAGGRRKAARRYRAKMKIVRRGGGAWIAGIEQQLRREVGRTEPAR
jgi:hypothetical protein